MNHKKLYKILVDGKSCHGGTFEWSLPKGKRPGKWHVFEGEPKICAAGFHLTTEPYNWYKWGCTNYEAEAENIVAWEDNKCVATKVRLIKEVPHPKWWTDTIDWIGNLKDIAWLKPDGKPNKEWRLFPTRHAARAAAWDAARAAARAAAWDAARDAAWDAARDAAWAAAWDAARDAAWDAARDAAWDAARDAAGAAAWDAARDAAGAAAWDAARDAARDAAGAAARDAALYARGVIVSDLKLESKHRKHIKARMEVWQKGYGLLREVDGVLYIYEKI